MADETFKWDAIEEDTFFNDSPEDLAEQAKSDFVNNDTIEGEETDTSSAKTTTVEKTDEELANELFNDEFEQSEEEEEEVETEDEGEQGIPGKGKEADNNALAPLTNKSVALYLQEKGLLDFELEEGQELTDELANSYIEDKFEDQVESRVAELMQDIPDVGKQFIQFISKGGNPYQFIQQFSSNDSGLTEDMDMTDESDQETVMRTVLASEGYDKDYIDNNIEFLKEKGKLESIAKTKFDKWLESENENRENLVKQQKEAVKAEKENRRKWREEIVEATSELEDIGGLSLTPKIKQMLPDYLSEKTIELESGGSITEFQKDIFEVIKNKNAAFQLAILLKGRKEDGTFDFSDIEKKAETTTTQQVKDTIRNASKGSTKTKKKVSNIVEYLMK